MSRGLMRALSTLAILAVTWANQLSTARAVCDTYTVQAGDSAVSIADKLQIDYDELLSALQSCIGFVEGSMLQIGQTVCLPPYTPACRFVSSSGECTRYTVQYGDTLSMVASSFELDMEALAEVNNLNLTTPREAQRQAGAPASRQGVRRVDGIEALDFQSSPGCKAGAEPAVEPTERRCQQQVQDVAVERGGVHRVDRSGHRGRHWGPQARQRRQISEEYRRHRARSVRVYSAV